MEHELTITISGKTACGKTTAAIEIAYHLRRLTGYDVVLMDDGERIYPPDNYQIGLWRDRRQHDPMTKRSVLITTEEK